MNDPDSRLIKLLADGHFHSGEAIARAFGISRSAVCKRLHGLATRLGLEIFSVRGRGYRLARPLQLLDREKILAEMADTGLGTDFDLALLGAVDSTNAWLLRGKATRGPRACLAEFQSAGRGRRGRQWLTPYAAGICLSVDWLFEDLPPTFTAMAMVIAVAACRALADCGVDTVWIKWPNDLLWQEQKLGGILIEMAGEPPGPCRVVVGIGINVTLPEAFHGRITQPVTDLAAAATAAGVEPPDRSCLAGRLLARQLEALRDFGKRGFEPFRAQWEARDLISGRGVALSYQGRTIIGTARGIDRDGALLLEHDGETRRYVSGDISLRLAT